VSTALAPKTSRVLRWRRLLAVIAIAIGVVGGFVGWRVYRVAADLRLLRDTLVELNARDPHWKLEDLEAARAPIPDAENAAVVIRAACAAILGPPIQPDYWKDPATLLTDAEYHAVINVLESAEAAIAPALKLEQFPRGRHPITYTTDGLSTRLPHMHDMNRLYDRILLPLLFIHTQEGDAAAAVRDCICILHLGRSLGDEPCGVSQVVRTWFAERAARGAERVLGQCVATDADLARLQAALAEEAALDVWPAFLRADRAMIHRFLVAVESGVIAPSVLRRLTTCPAGGPRTALDRALEQVTDRFPPAVADAHAWLLRRITQLMDETANRPWHERTAAVEAYGAAERDAPALVREWTNMPGVLKRFQIRQAVVRCMLVGLAAERYRLKHGAWPVAPTELVPAFLPSPLPADPFDGQPLRFKRLPDGVVIYSVGADRVDDRGQVRAVGTSQAATDDGVRLWDPAARRQPPPAGGGP
jgi:hypothetical protein